uniref:Centrosomal protein 120 n=1 Tax=Fundulus heteroclitus TaxID=8078 RepID=A0A3Q2Q1Y4_FUNHE
MVQASFDGEHLETDPVEHREQPQFCTELAWELDRKTLHQHRLQRTPIKLQCFALDPSSKKKENVGYVVLDLRSVTEVRQEPRWHQLLSSKYTKQKPALLVSVILENDSKAEEPSPETFKAKKAPPRQGSASVSGLLPETLEARLIPDQGYHQVGPAERCNDMFVLSVTVAFATKLEQLIPSTKKLTADDSGFFFYYSLLGNDITSEPFHNLLSPDFEPERASVRLRSSSQVLRSFLSQQPGLQIHLCCGNRSLGSTDVSLAALAAASVDLENTAATVEGAFVLQPPKRTKLPPLPAELQPTVGVAVTLRREELLPQVHPIRGPFLPAAPPAEQRAPSPSPVRKPDSPPAPLPPPSSRTESEAESLLEELDLHRKQTLPAPPPAQPEAAAGASSVSVSAPKVSIPSSAHHYCFSLDLRSLAKLALPHPIAATLRYSYQFFGSSAPIMTNPPVELQRNMEASLPQSYCAFDFAALPHQLQDTFLRVPLVVELWDRGSSSRDQLVGLASIQLHRLLGQEKTAWTGEPRWRQTHQDRIPVVHPQRPTERVAELSYAATLEDLGFVKSKEVLVSDSSQVSPAVPQPPSHPAAPEHPSAPQGPAAPTAPRDTRDTLEYRAALELEMWKEEQEDLAAAPPAVPPPKRSLCVQIADGESRYKQLEKEFQLYREQQNVRPEFRLQSEINLLTLEKVELERKLESATKSKLHYKQQWGRALKELARFKQREQENAMGRLKKQQAELEAMRLRYLATEEKEAVRQDRQELDDIRNELNRLKKQEEERLGPAPADPGSAPSLNLNESAEEHLSRLLEERDTLLRTGVYTHQDRIIAELNRQIQEAMRDRKL